MAKTRRNDPCPCGSGRKFKKCCVRDDEIGLLDPGPVSQHTVEATDRMMKEEGYTQEVAERLRVIDKRKRLRGQLVVTGLVGMLAGERLKGVLR